MRACAYCGATAVYRDRLSGTYLCLLHARLEVTGPRGEMSRPPITIRPAVSADRPRVAELITCFRGGVEVMCFDRRYQVDELPAYVACDAGEVVGTICYAQEGDAINLVALHMLPRWQGQGMAHWLIAVVIEVAISEGVKRLIVATTNDDLPGLALYQRAGFVITDVQVGEVAKRQGEIVHGTAGIPVRDEIQMEMLL